MNKTIREIRKQTTVIMAKLKKEDTSEREYTVGQTVKHTKFGTGQVINSVDGESIKVQFGKRQVILLLKYNKTTLLEEK
jgi:hypothetical protein